MSSLVIQDASGTTEEANSYASVAQFRQYHTMRGTDVSSHTDADVEAGLIRACDYLDTRFSFIGNKLNDGDTQTTEWPRSNAYDADDRYVDGIPEQVRRAQIEYALRALTAPLVADPPRDASGRLVQSESATVGPISESKTYAAGGAVSMPAYPAADRLLTMRGLIKSGRELRRA